MAEVKQARPAAGNDDAVHRGRGFWERNSKAITIAGLAVILLGGGYLAYKYLYVAPKQRDAQEQMYKAEEYFRQDSLRLALKGDGRNPGFERIISQYGGTDAGNMARYYAGAIYLKTGEFGKAESSLEEFSTDAKQIQARAYKLLGDAYAEQGKNSDALESYKKAAKTFESDENASADYLFSAGYFADRVMNNKDEAIKLYKELKQKYPRSQYALEVDKYLAAAGVYSTED